MKVPYFLDYILLRVPYIVDFILLGVPYIVDYILLRVPYIVDYIQYGPIEDVAYRGVKVLLCHSHLHGNANGLKKESERSIQRSEQLIVQCIEQIIHRAPY